MFFWQKPINVMADISPKRQHISSSGYRDVSGSVCSKSSPNGSFVGKKLTDSVNRHIDHCDETEEAAVLSASGCKTR